MVDYLIAYRIDAGSVLYFYRFAADDAEHAIEQFRNAEPDKRNTIVFVVLS